MDYFLGLSEEGFHRVAYSQWGKSNSAHPPVICVHGLTRNKHDFDSLASHFGSRGRHLFCPDIVGRGDSDWLKNSSHYNFSQYCSDLNALIARTESTEVDWIGTSMGGLLGIILASKPASPIRRLVMNDIGPYIPGEALIRLSSYTGKTPDFSSMDEAVKYYKVIYADFGDLTEVQWRHLVENSVREAAPGLFRAKIDPAITAVSAKNILLPFLHPIKALNGTLFSVDLWSTWRNVSCPVLVIHGKRSDILLPETIQQMQATHPDTTVIEVSDTGHAPTLLDAGQQEMIYRWLLS